MGIPSAYWLKRVEEYSQKNWSKKESLFAQETIKYFPKHGDLLELGSGAGQDGRWFASQGYNVTITDLTDQSFRSPQLKFQIVDMSQPLPFEPEQFDIIYSQLSLHYFTWARTQKLFEEIHNSLKPNGVLAFMVNTVEDPEIGEGEMLEPDYLMVDGIKKRYFDVPTVEKLTSQGYEILLLDDRGTSYKDREKGITNLIRFVGRKTA